MYIQTVKLTVSLWLETVFAVIAGIAVYVISGALSMWMLGAVGLELTPAYADMALILGLCSPIVALIMVSSPMKFSDPGKKVFRWVLKITMFVGFFMPTLIIGLMSFAKYLSCVLDGFCSS